MMATVSKFTADEIIAGKYPEDNIVKIVEYTSIFGPDRVYGTIIKRDDPNRYKESAYVKNPTIYWEQK